MNKQKETTLAVVLLIAGFIIALTGATILSGFTLATLWGWFVAGYFGVKALSIPAAIGISGLVRMMTFTMPKKDENNEPDWGMMVVYWYLIPICFLGCGWITQMFM